MFDLRLLLLTFYQELTFFSDSLGELKEVQTKFADSGEAVASLVTDTDTQIALIPLTESVRCLKHSIIYIHLNRCT